MQKKLIVIEGLDGSGKATQSKLLVKTLEERGEIVRKLEFPDYANPSSSLVKMYLDGTFGQKAEDVNAYAAASFYAVDRIASYLQFWQEDYKNGATVISDRYATSNVIYHMSKLPVEKWDEFIDWEFDFEYKKLGIPKPDLVIYLDVEPEVSQKLMQKRYNGDMSKMDLHEKDFAYLLECRKSALYAAEKCGWHIINCCAGGNIKSIEQIEEEVLNIYDKF